MLNFSGFLRYILWSFIPDSLVAKPGRPRKHFNIGISAGEKSVIAFRAIFAGEGNETNRIGTTEQTIQTILNRVHFETRSTNLPRLPRG
jgi:hypothetical protein